MESAPDPSPDNLPSPSPGSPPSLSPDVVRHVANLSRLALTDDEIARFSEQLSSVAGHFHDLDAQDTTDVVPATHALPLKNVFRKDELREGLSTDELLRGAPASEAHMFRVPKILIEE